MFKRWPPRLGREQGNASRSRRKVLVIHPFLFAWWPVLFIYSQNVQIVPFSQAWTPLFVLSLFALTLLLLLAAILRSWMKGGAIVSLFTLLFFSFGYVYDLLWADLAAFVRTSESVALMIVWAIVFAGGTWLVLRTKGYWPAITKVLNAMSLTLVGASLISVGVYELGEGMSRRQALATFEISAVESVDPAMRPNIYYIILDAYGRGDILEEVYRYDNSWFLDSLTELGFYVADGSCANYGQTDPSLASSLNLNYLDSMLSLVDPESEDRGPLKELAQQSAAVRFLKEQGYEIVSLSGYGLTDLGSADVRIGPNAGWNELETRLVCSTPIAWLADAGGAFDLPSLHRQGILHAVDRLADTASLDGPQFVFAHILAPHGPFVFDKEGNPIDYEREFDLQDGIQYDEEGQIVEEYVQGYTGQLAFISTRITSAIEELLARSSRPTVVILQSDHGPGYPLDLEDPGSSLLRQKMAILNAYLLPGGDYSEFYPEISPVNTFRLIFNQYLGTELELLEDESYYSTWTHPYRFVNVTDLVRSGGAQQPQP